jgi:hypothetical protein
MAFNIYKWRRDQLLIENSIYNNPDDLYTGNLDAGQKEDDKKMLQQLLNWYKSQDDADPSMINKLEMQIGGINETKVSSITFSKDVLYPTSIAMGSSKKIKSEEEFKAWQEKFKKDYGDIELEKGAAGWKASSKHEANKQAQADADKNAKRK